MHHYNYIHTWPQIHSLKFYSVVFIVLNVCTMYSSMYVILIAIVIMFFFCSSHAVAYRGHFDWGGGCLFQNLPTKLNKNHAKMTSAIKPGVLRKSRQVYSLLGRNSNMPLPGGVHVRRVQLGGSGAWPPRKMFEICVSEMVFPRILTALWSKS